jgi:hypothetical protein
MLRKSSKRSATGTFRVSKRETPFRREGEPTPQDRLRARSERCFDFERFLFFYEACQPSIDISVITILAGSLCRAVYRRPPLPSSIRVGARAEHPLLRTLSSGNRIKDVPQL